MAAPLTGTTTSAPAVAPAAANLLANGGFESGFAGWSDWGNTSVVTGPASSGSYALRVGTAAGGAGHDVTGIVAGGTYLLAVQGKVSDASETGFVGVNFVDAAGNVIGQGSAAFGSTTYQHRSR